MDEPFPDVATALTYLGYVQIDPLNVGGHRHDAVLRNCVAGYRDGDLFDFIHGPGRPGFEQYLPDAGMLAAFPLASRSACLPWGFASESAFCLAMVVGKCGLKTKPPGGFVDRPDIL